MNNQVAVGVLALAALSATNAGADCYERLVEVQCHAWSGYGDQAVFSIRSFGTYDGPCAHGWPKELADDGLFNLETLFQRPMSCDLGGKSASFVLTKYIPSRPKGACAEEHAAAELRVDGKTVVGIDRLHGHCPASSDHLIEASISTVKHCRIDYPASQLDNASVECRSIDILNLGSGPKPVDSEESVGATQ